MQVAANIYISYAIEDDSYKDRLEEHLAQLKREGLIQHIWSMETVSAGSHQWKKHEQFIAQADLVLLLISSDFISSNNYDTELGLILPQVKQRNIPVIPIILRACLWKGDVLENFQPFPSSGSPIVGDKKLGEDQYFSLVAKEIRNLLQAPKVPKKSTSKGKIKSYMAVLGLLFLLVSSGLYFTTCQRKNIPPESPPITNNTKAQKPPNLTSSNDQAAIQLFQTFSEALLLKDIEATLETVLPLFHPSLLDADGRLEQSELIRPLKALYRIAHNDVYEIPFRIVRKRDPIPNQKTFLEDEFGEGNFVTYFLAKKDPKNRPFPITLFFGTDSIPKIKQLSF